MITIEIAIIRSRKGIPAESVVCVDGVAVAVDMPVVAVADTYVVGVDVGVSTGGASGGRSGRLLSATGSLTAGLS